MVGKDCSKAASKAVFCGIENSCTFLAGLGMGSFGSAQWAACSLKSSLGQAVCWTCSLAAELDSCTASSTGAFKCSEYSSQRTRCGFQSSLT